jgi:hypothetical protein
MWQWSFERYAASVNVYGCKTARQGLDSDNEIFELGMQKIVRI